MAPAGCCGSRRRASSRERSRRIGPGGGWRPAVNGPGRLLRGRAGVCSRAAVHARGLVPRLLRPVPAFPVFCCPRPVARVLRSAFCVLHPVPPLPVPASASTCSAFCVLRPTPASSVFRVPHPHPRPCALCPWPRTRVSCAPCPCPRLLRSADGSPRSAPYLPPPTLRGGSFRLRHAAGMKRKSGGSPEEPPDFACIAAARLTRACG